MNKEIEDFKNYYRNFKRNIKTMDSFTSLQCQTALERIYKSAMENSNREEKEEIKDWLIMEERIERNEDLF